jgi:23S rRNA (uracil1939-C5)-methyltransferase
VEVPQCVVHHPRINAAAAAVTAAAARCGVRAYDELDGTGQLRYVQLTAAARAGQGSADKDPLAAVQVALIWNAPAPGDGDEDEDVPESARAFADEIWRMGGEGEGEGEDGPPLIHSVWVNFNDSRANDIVGDTWAHVAVGRCAR